MNIFLVLSILTVTFCSSGLVEGSSLNVSVELPGHRVSPHLWGIFFEEINHAGDGGLYAELIKNRGLSPKAPSIEGYGAVGTAGTFGRLLLSPVEYMNDVFPNSLQLHIETPIFAGGAIGISNEGYFGIPIRPDYTEYKASFYAKSNDLTGRLTARIQKADGSIVFALATTTAQLSTNWQKFEVTLTPESFQIQNPSLDNVFIVTVDGPINAGTSIFFNLVSLFPPTFNNRPNGLRLDLAKKLADAKPTFFRFPGGNFLEGDRIQDRFIWEETIGDISLRPGTITPWGYYSTNGLGLLEYLEFSEDLNAEIVLGIYAGYSLLGDSVPIEEMGPYIESALNEIEYIIGNTSTVWGARRAADGHPAPFPLTYVEIGNEDWFSNDYHIRYPLFYDAITEKYPQLEIIATQDVDTRPIPIRDDHFYPGFGWFPDNHRLYDDAPRNGSKIFVGEYATRNNTDWSFSAANTATAMDDAAFMTGMERNSDIVIMACYAPLFGHLSDLRWSPDAIYYNGVQSFATPAWWVQHLFSVHQGDTYVPTVSDANDGRPQEKIFHVASRDTASNKIILKIVNTWTEDILIDTVRLEGIAGIKDGSTMTMLTGGRYEENDLQNPLRVSPSTVPFTMTGNSFTFNAPAFSLTIFELQL